MGEGMSARNRHLIKGARHRAMQAHSDRWHDAYRHASLITAWCLIHSGHGLRPNRERRRGNLTHGRHGQFTHPMVGRGQKLGNK